MEAVYSTAAEQEPRAARLSKRTVVLMAAAAFGGIAGGLFSTEIVHTAMSVWSNYIVPAYFELLMSGIPFCA